MRFENCFNYDSNGNILLTRTIINPNGCNEENYVIDDGEVYYIFGGQNYLIYSPKNFINQITTFEPREIRSLLNDSLLIKGFLNKPFMKKVVDSTTIYIYISNTIDVIIHESDYECFIAEPNRFNYTVNFECSIGISFKLGFTQMLMNCEGFNASVKVINYGSNTKKAIFEEIFNKWD